MAKTSPVADPSSVPQVVRDLVANFAEHQETYHRPGYNESQLRADFLDPLFIALGWDIYNTAGSHEAYRDVILEQALRVATPPRDYHKIAPHHQYRSTAIVAMPSTYLSLHDHLVFSTKHLMPTIDAAWRDRLHEYLGGTIRGLGGVSEGVGGVAEHVHLLIGLKATHCLADVLRELKKASSVWVHEEIGLATSPGQKATPRSR